jgi:hypothetical protein
MDDLTLSEFSRNPVPAKQEINSKSVGRLRWYFSSGSLPEDLGRLWEDPDSFLSDPTLLLAAGGGARLVTLGVIPDPVGGVPPLLLRRLNYRSLLHRLRDTFRPTRAERAFKHGLAMERAGIPTPRVFAAGVERICRVPIRAYFLSEFIPNARTLRDLVIEQGSLTKDQIRELAEMVAHLHNSGFSNRDLKWTNIIYDSALKPHFIDLDGIRHHNKVNAKTVAKNLSHLTCGFFDHILPQTIRWSEGAPVPGRDRKFTILGFLKCYCRKRGMQGKLRSLYGAIVKDFKSRVIRRAGRG